MQFVLLATAWWLNTRGEDPNQLSLARQAGTDVKMTSVLRKLLRPLASDPQDSGTRLDLEAGRAS